MSKHSPPERLQKLLARAGLGSRREIEGWIAAGEVTVNGEPATLGMRASLTDRIKHKGRLLSLNHARAQAPRVLAYHKPEGEVSTQRDPQGRPTVFQALPKGRWISIGRLDVNTLGLLLFTNDGELAHRLMHPSSELEREYAVRVRGELSEAQRTQLLEGVMLEDGAAKFASVEAGKAGEGANHWYHVVLREGRKREVRRLWEAVGLTVSRLIRVRYGDVKLTRWLSAGKWEELDEAQVRGLYHAAGLDFPQPDAEHSQSGKRSRPVPKRHQTPRQRG
ncbi:23S rRNA pseudouridine(2605) synthase RluB [Acidihalobacter ferrooxydans]|uniref:Pseudouridine synthase n=1 Tax=Acidihalobacter ferrooxydans TaxID=1765967 RepID=A0A1P8UGD1_9GAMM|nr:pseudouridine synthase [Acidihalobacter ferrooxydans]APZ42879.1 23S rRNA pseudouridylate synthase B [Acidihalobacter ferrooxydans]